MSKIVSTVGVENELNTRLRIRNVKSILSNIFEVSGGSGSSGDVVGPASATNNNFSLFDGTTGKLLKNSSFSSTDAANAITAFGWGNHASAGYITLSGTQSLTGNKLINGTDKTLSISLDNPSLTGTDITLESGDFTNSIRRGFKTSDVESFLFYEDPTGWATNNAYGVVSTNQSGTLIAGNTFGSAAPFTGDGAGAYFGEDPLGGIRGFNLYTVSGGVTTSRLAFAHSGAATIGATNLQLTGDLGSTGSRINKGWFTDLQVTNAIAGSITGNAATVTTNANLSGHITSSGNTTSLGSFTKAQLDGAVSDGNVLYVGDVTTNATHTGEVTGSGALTVDKTAITNKTLVTADALDHVLIADASDSDNLKKVLVSDFGGGSGDMLLGTIQTVTALKTFNTSTFAIRNPANTFSYNFLGSAIVANRDVTIPLLTAADVFVMQAFAQTLTNKTISFTSNTISMTKAELLSAVSDDDVLFAGDLGAGLAIETGDLIVRNTVYAPTITANAYTLIASDDKKILHIDNGATAVTVNLPNSLVDHFSCTIVNTGTGILTIAAATTLNSDGTTIETQYTGALVYHQGSNIWKAVGSLGAPVTGGGVSLGAVVAQVNGMAMV